MDSNEQNKVIAFDTLFSTNHIAMLKIMLPYMDNQTQKSLAVYIKLMELNYTLDFYKKHPYPVCGCMEKEASPDLLKLCEELLPYCTEDEKKQIEQIRNIFQSMEMYKEMSKTMELMKDFMPDMGSFGDLFSGKNSSGQNSGTPDIMNMLMNMMTPEQKEMFNLFGGNGHDK
ncbi:MAG: hypothetical protein ACI4ED_02980 [Suilimivivens sp.]